MSHSFKIDSSLSNLKFCPGFLLWGLSLLLLTVDAIWLSFISLRFDFHSLLFVGGVNSVLAFGAWYYYVKRPRAQFFTLFMGVLYLSLITLGIGLLSYCLTRLALPLHDQTYSAIDQSLGFDWITVVGFINQSPWLSKILTYAYHSSGLQMIGLILLLAFTQKFDDLKQFFQLFTLTGLVVIVIAGLFPSVGPYAFYGPSAEVYSHFSSQAGVWHLEHMSALREGRMELLNIRDLEGLVSFPSFHTCLALITIWCTRHFRYLFPLSLILNLLVIISTIPEGGHYLVDLFGGMAITFVVLVLLEWKKTWAGSLDGWLQARLSQTLIGSKA